jgi:hypothetical protein
MLQVDNQTDSELTIGSFKKSDPLFGSSGWPPSPYEWHWAASNGGPISVNLGESHGYLTVWNQHLNFWASVPDQMQDDTKAFNIGPFSEDDYIAITKRYSHMQWVDWNAVQAQWQGIVSRAPAVGSNGSPDLGLNMAMSQLGTLTAGIEAFSPAAALPAAAVYSIASMLLQMFDYHHSDPPPPPPSIDQIVQGVKAVITEELDSNTAQQKASTFMNAAVWLETWINKSHSAIYGLAPTPSDGELGDHDYWDFRGELEDYAKATGTFQNDLTSIATNPNWARYILPSFIVGLTSSLLITRLHDLVRSYDGERLTNEDLLAFCNRAESYKGSLDNAAKSFSALVASKVYDAKLDGTPLGNKLTSIITNTLTGSQDLNFIGVAKTKIDRIVTIVASDISALKMGQQAQHYYRPEWATHPRGPQRRKPQ